MDKIKKTNMNIKKITIAMLITLISIGYINAQEMKTEIPKLANSLQEMKTPGLNNISRGSLGWRH